mmetsp:Transcript_85181/g.237787  ORF Transcript_85181/g.237787 Transcript_85181/m.237787 type:complete len:288 (-) Transcript_85181:910-1773(-)
MHRIDRPCHSAVAKTCAFVCTCGDSIQEFAVVGDSQQNPRGKLPICFTTILEQHFSAEHRFQFLGPFRASVAAITMERRGELHLATKPSVREIAEQAVLRQKPRKPADREVEHTRILASHETFQLHAPRICQSGTTATIAGQPPEVLALRPRPETCPTSAFAIVVEEEILPTSRTASPKPEPISGLARKWHCEVMSPEERHGGEIIVRVHDFGYGLMVQISHLGYALAREGLEMRNHRGLGRKEEFVRVKAHDPRATELRSQHHGKLCVKHLPRRHLLPVQRGELKE